MVVYKKATIHIGKTVMIRQPLIAPMLIARVRKLVGKLSTFDDYALSLVIVECVFKVLLLGFVVGICAGIVICIGVARSIQ